MLDPLRLSRQYASMPSSSPLAPLAFILICMLSAVATAAAAEPDFVYRDAIPGVDPMGLHGIDPEVAAILRGYYEHSLGGRTHWSEVESIRFDGTLRVPQGEFSFVAYKKKPDYCKIVLLGERGARITMAYDGADAWQLNSADPQGAVAMPSAEALNFIRDATTGGHLLYPTLPGKRIELLGKRRVLGLTCYELRVTLPNGQQVTYAIDRASSVERQQIVVNPVSGATEVTTHMRNNLLEGLSIPVESTMTVDGEFMHEVRMQGVKVNTGLTTAMFKRPAASAWAGEQPVEGLGWSGASRYSEPAAVGGDSAFHVTPSPTLGAEQSAFPDLDTEAEPSILDTLKKY
jgi:hypothetical protein